MKKILFVLALFIFLLIPFYLFSITLPYMRVGYVDLEKIMQIYTPKFLEAEIKAVEEDISLLLFSYDSINPIYSEPELYEMQKRIQDTHAKLSNLKLNRQVWNKYGEVEDDVILEKIQKNIMEAIKKTGVSEGYGLIIDRTGNFVYASGEIDLTSKILFRLEENLMDDKSCYQDREDENP